MKFLNFRTHFGGSSQNENKIGKNIHVIQNRSGILGLFQACENTLENGV